MGKSGSRQMRTETLRSDVATLRSGDPDHSNAAIANGRGDRDYRLIVRGDLVQSFTHCYYAPRGSLDREREFSFASACGDQYLLMKIWPRMLMTLPVNQ